MMNELSKRIPLEKIDVILPTVMKAIEDRKKQAQAQKPKPKAQQSPPKQSRK